MLDRVDDGISPENRATLDRLVRAIDLAEGFALFFARCNIPVLRRELIAAAKQQLDALGVSVVEVAFEEEIVNLRARLAEALEAAETEQGAPVPGEIPARQKEPVVAEPANEYAVYRKRVLFITGLEYSIPYQQPNARLLAELNLGRDFFHRDTPFPVVIWLPDYAVTAVARYAPDFWAWRSGVFEFSASEAERTIAVEHLVGNGPSWRTLANLTMEDRRLRRRQLESLLDDYRDLADREQVTRERAVILTDLGNVCARSQDYPEALDYFEQALSMHRQVGDRTSEAMTLNNIGTVYDRLGEKQHALEYYEQALPLARQVGDRTGQAMTLNNIGTVYADLGKQRKALEYYEQALPLARQVGDQTGEAMTLNNIGAVYEALGKQRKALDYYEQALSLQRQVGDRAGEAMTLNNTGMVYFALGEQRKALECYEQALFLMRQVGDLTSEATTLNNIGLIYSTLGEKRQALDHYEQAVVLLQQAGNRWYESVGRANLAGVYRELGNWEKAEKQLELVVALDEAIGHPDLESNRAALSRVQEKRRQHEEG